MPRKAIRINASVPSDEVAAAYFDFWVQGDLYRHPERFPPLTSEALFQNQQPLALEVGPGTGEWLISRAQQQSEWNFLGIDVYAKALYKAVAAAHEAELRNIRFIRAPIQFTYPLIQPRSLAALYLHYPDPNLRNRGQHKIANATFLEVAARALVPGGTLSLITDHDELFFEEILPLVEADGRWTRQHAERYLTGYEPEVKSRYQKMWEKHDVPPKRLLLARLGSGA